MKFKWLQWLLFTERSIQETIPFFDYLPCVFVYLFLAGLFVVILESFLVPKDVIEDLMEDEDDNEISILGRKLIKADREKEKMQQSKGAAAQK